MDDYREEQSNTQQPEEKQPGRGGTFLRRLGTLLVTLLIVLGILAVSMMGDGNFMDRFRRWLSYGTAAEEDRYQFAADANNRYGQVGKYLVVLNQNYIQFLEDNGTAYHTAEELGLSQPALDTGGGLALAYDVGGQNLFVLSPDETKLELSLPDGYGYISARLNDSGWLAVTAEKSGYRGAVSVYNAQQELVYEVELSSQFVVDALVDEDCRSVLVATYGEADGAFATQMIRYDLTEEEPVQTEPLPDHVGFDLEQVEGDLVSVSDSSLAFVQAAGGLEGAYSYGGQYLQDYAFGADFTALFLTRYQAGSIGTLVTLDSHGNLLGVLEVSDEILDIDAAGSYLAVLQSNALVIYTSDLTAYGSLEDTDYASHVLMGADGSALVIGGNEAWRYLP